jgi:hypothetical protein
LYEGGEELWPHLLEVDACFSGPRTHFDRGLGFLNRQIPHADEVTRGCRKGEDPSDLEDSTMPNLSQQRDCLQPSEALFNALPLFLGKQEYF